MKTYFLTLGVLCVLANLSVAAEPITLKLWPDGPPTAVVPKSEATVKLIQSYGGAGPNRVTDVSDPTITVFRPEKPNGTSVIVAPGGGFMFLSYAHEGTQVCEWLNSLGVTAVLLKYRTPTRDEKEMFELPVQDAKRALGLVRHHAAEWISIRSESACWAFRPERTSPGTRLGIAAIGPFYRSPIAAIHAGRISSCSSMAGASSTTTTNRSCVPASVFRRDAPPVFMLVAHDDKSNPVEAAMLYLEYKKRDLSAELHICAKGGHGFGLRKDGKPINDWPQRCAEWMKSLGYLDARLRRTMPCQSHRWRRSWWSVVRLIASERKPEVSLHDRVRNGHKDRNSRNAQEFLQLEADAPTRILKTICDR